MYDPTQFLVGGVTDVHVAPLGTAMPADESVALNAAFIHLGLTVDDGVGFSVAYETETRTSSQLLDPTLRVRTGRDTTVTAGFQQFNEDTVPLAFGGGEVVETAADSGTFKYDAPDGDVIDYRAAVLHVVNGGKVGRICIPKLMVTETDEATFQKSQEVVLALTFGVIATGVAKPWYILGNADFFGIAV